jgi:hypothetical protein
MDHCPEFKKVISLVGKMAQTLRLYADGHEEPGVAQRMLREYDRTIEQLRHPQEHDRASPVGRDRC